VQASHQPVPAAALEPLVLHHELRLDQVHVISRQPNEVRRSSLTARTVGRRAAQ
jgi:hypothetical protein